MLPLSSRFAVIVAAVFSEAHRQMQAAWRTLTLNRQVTRRAVNVGAASVRRRRNVKVRIVLLFLCLLSMLQTTRLAVIGHVRNFSVDKPKTAGML